MRAKEQSNLRVKKFVDEYFKNGGVGNKAAEALGLKGGSARTAAHRYLSDERVQKEIARRREKIEQACDISDEKWTALVWGIASNAEEKTSDRLVASDMIAKKYGYYAKQKIDVTSDNEKLGGVVLVLPEIGEIKNAQSS